MSQISKILLQGKKQQKQMVREKLALGYEAEARIKENEQLLHSLSYTPLKDLDKKVGNGGDLTFEETLCGMCYLLAATNYPFAVVCQEAFNKACDGIFSEQRALASGTAFAKLMADKESFRVLTPEEVAGMAAGGLMDIVIRLNMGRVVETCGMGADTGFAGNGVTKKTINASTLASFVLASLKLPVIKHGSYSSTSVVGSTEAIEHLGVRTNMDSAKEAMDIWNDCGFCYFDAHWCKTIHDLSHLLMIETINHVVGPMSPPITRETEINKLMGVNKKIHPSVVARAYTILHQRRQQKIGSVAIVCGLDKNCEQIDPNNFEQVKKHAILDELSPYVSVVSLAHADRFLGNFLVRPSDFGIELIAEKIQVVNEESQIQKANKDALSGENPQLKDFLAMNAALGLFVEKYLGLPEAVSVNGLNTGFLQECFKVCSQAILSGKTLRILEKYVKASNGMV